MDNREICGTCKYHEHEKIEDGKLDEAWMPLPKPYIGEGGIK